MKRLLLLAISVLLVGCATPGYVSSGGTSHTPKVFVAGVTSTQARDFIRPSLQRWGMRLVEDTPTQMRVTTAPYIRPHTRARYTFVEHDGGTLITVTEEYIERPGTGRERIRAVNNPTFIAKNQAGLESIRRSLQARYPRTVMASTTSYTRPASSGGYSRCAAITRAGYRCTRSAQPGRSYCWQH